MQYISNVIAFFFIYSLSSLFRFILSIYSPKEKTIKINNNPLYAFLSFPIVNLRFKKSNGKKKKITRANAFSPASIVFSIMNQLILIGAVILQFVPKIPCNVISVQFSHWKHKIMSFVVDTYNQKIPLLSISLILCIQFLYMFLNILVLIIKDTELRKRLGIWAIIGVFLIILLDIAVVCHLLYLLFIK